LGAADADAVGTGLGEPPWGRGPTAGTSGVVAGSAVAVAAEGGVGGAALLVVMAAAVVVPGAAAVEMAVAVALGPPAAGPENWVR
jgi:hypothetical protein